MVDAVFAEVPQQNNRSSWKHVCDISEKKMMKRKQRDSDPSENEIKKGLVCVKLTLLGKRG
jgi:hypothetical protein